MTPTVALRLREQKATACADTDEQMIIASAGLWQCMSHTEAVRRVRPIADSTLAAKHLCDIAQV